MRKKNFFVWFLLSLCLLFLLFLNLKIVNKERELLKKAQNLQAEIEALNAKKEELKQKIEKTQKEKFWEEKARERGFIKKGEEPFIIQFK